MSKHLCIVGILLIPFTFLFAESLKKNKKKPKFITEVLKAR